MQRRKGELENLEIWRLENLQEEFNGSVGTENQKKPPPSPLSEGESGGGKAIERQFLDLLDLWEERDESDDFIDVYKMYIRDIVYQ